nr:reverse transcriptase domain, reverse transcriptase zinc-binding domain protein [Tanacetum cinerariifolium]
MRTKRDQKVPQNLKDYVHGINTVKNKSKKNVTKKNENINEKLSVNNQNTKNNGESDFVGKGIEINSEKGMGNDGKKGFDGDLNDEGCNSENNSIKSVDCSEKVNNEEEEVVKQSGNGKIVWGSGSGGISLADMIKGSKLDNKLMHVPAVVSDNGENIMIFDDEIIELGSQKWSLTVCGQFIRCTVGFNEARYHIKRMWHKFGLKDVIAENGVFYFKFQDEEGINEVINNGPWMVNNKPLVVQKWCIDMCMDKAEPKKIPVLGKNEKCS